MRSADLIVSCCNLIKAKITSCSREFNFHNTRVLCPKKLHGDIVEVCLFCGTKLSLNLKSSGVLCRSILVSTYVNTYETKNGKKSFHIQYVMVMILVRCN